MSTEHTHWRTVARSSAREPDVLQHIARIMSSYGRITPGRLIDISHAKGAPWAHVVDKGRTGVAFGLNHR